MDLNDKCFFKIIKNQVAFSISLLLIFNQLVKKLDKISVLQYICKFVEDKVEQYSI